MNLRELREYVANIADYNPATQGYANEMTTLLNRAYFDLWMLHPWVFAYREEALPVEPDITPDEATAEAGAAVVAYANPGTRYITLSAGDTYYSGPSRLHLNATKWKGQHIRFGGRDYTISNISNVNLAAPEVGSAVIVETFEEIRSDAVGTTPLTDTNWLVKYVAIPLPEDCISAANVNFKPFPVPSGRDSIRELVEVPYQAANNLAPDEDETGTSTHYWYLPDVRVPAAGKTTAGTNVTATLDGLDPGTYEVTWCYEGPYGTLGPLAEPVEVTVPDDGSLYFVTIAARNHDGTIARSASALSSSVGQTVRNADPLHGLATRYFVNVNYDYTNGKRLGIPAWKPISVLGVAPDAYSSQTDYQKGRIATEPYRIGPGSIPTCSVAHQEQMENTLPIYWETDGRYKHIRLHPRSDNTLAYYGYVESYTDAGGINEPDDITDNAGDVRRFPTDKYERAIVRYHYKPKPMVYPTDGPELPFEFHHLIALKALHHVFAKSGDMTQAQVYETQFSKALPALERRYLTHGKQVFQRGQFDRNGPSPYYDTKSLRRLN